MIVKELEDRHQRFDVLIHKAQSAASHALTNSAVHEGSAYDYKVPVATTPDGSKHNSLPTVSEDTSYSAPLSTLGHLGSRSSKGSTTALKSDITVNSPAKILPQVAPTAGIAFLHALILMALGYGSYIIVSSNQRRHAVDRGVLRSYIFHKLHRAGTSEDLYTSSYEKVLCDEEDADFSVQDVTLVSKYSRII